MGREGTHRSAAGGAISVAGGAGTVARKRVCIAGRNAGSVQGGLARRAARAVG